MAKAAKKTVKNTARGRQEATSARGGSDVTVKTSRAASAATPSPFQELERVFEDFLNRRWPRPSGWDWPRFGELSTLLDRQVPSLDIVDGDNDVVIRAELPGVEKKDLDVSLIDRTLTIKGSTRKEEKEEKKNYFRQEIKTGSFSRSVLLPADVNAAKAEATFKGGLLELKLPKTKPAKLQKVSLTS
jgi:HSP20 family protein